MNRGIDIVVVCLKILGHVENHERVLGSRNSRGEKYFHNRCCLQVLWEAVGTFRAVYCAKVGGLELSKALCCTSTFTSSKTVPREIVPGFCSSELLFTSKVSFNEETTFFTINT